MLLGKQRFSTFLITKKIVKGSREQIAISEFAAALLVIPKTLASNGAHQATSLTAKLHAAHVRFIRNGEEKLRNVGLNLETGSLRDNLKSGVLEPAMSKVKSIKFATEAAIALLRIDDAVEAAPKPEKPPRR